MPQLTLEFSSNLLEKNNLTNLFKQCHTILSETLPTQLSSCKSRAIKCKRYVVGDGHPDNAFVHINLKVLPGRTLEKRNILGEKIMETLKQFFSDSINKLNLQITLEIMELQPTYFKFTSK